jgi:DNA-binding MarR family transcriptional regulator
MTRSVQSPPAAEVELAGRLRLAVGMLCRWLRQRDPGGLSPAQLSALSHLDLAGPLRLGDLAGRERVAAPTATRVVGALEQAGLVTRGPDPADRRGSLVAITAVGRQALDEVRRERTTLLAQRLAALSDMDRAAIADALAALEAIPVDPGRT